MSGGSKGKSKKAATTAAVAAPKPSFSEYGSMPIVNTIDPFMGNNQQLLAAQMAAGFGGTPQGYIDQSQAIYRPSQSVGLFEPLTETKAALAAGGYNMGGTTGLLSLDRVLGVGAAASNSSNNVVNQSNNEVSYAKMGNLTPGHPDNPFARGAQ